jgi:hypothetical protein
MITKNIQIPFRHSRIEHGIPHRLSKLKVGECLVLDANIPEGTGRNAAHYGKSAGRSFAFRRVSPVDLKLTPKQTKAYARADGKVVAIWRVS